MTLIYKVAFLLMLTCSSIHNVSAAVVDLQLSPSMIEQSSFTNTITGDNTLNLISVTADLLINDMGNQVRNDVTTLHTVNFNNHDLFFVFLIMVLYCAIKIMDVHNFKQR